MSKISFDADEHYTISEQSDLQKEFSGIKMLTENHIKIELTNKKHKKRQIAHVLDCVFNLQASEHYLLRMEMHFQGILYQLRAILICSQLLKSL